MSKNIFILYFLFTTISVALSQNSIQTTVNNILKNSSLKNASFTFRVIDIEKDSVLAEHNPITSLVPASTMKLVTTAAAMDILGSYKTFKTTLQYDGYIDSNCTLHGNIYIKGGGDATLGSKYFLSKDEKATDFMNKWVHEIENLGIHAINGRVIGDASYFSQDMIPATWVWGDMGNYYGAGPSGLTIYDNLSTLSFSSENKNGGATSVDSITPYNPEVTINNKVTAANINSDNAYLLSAPYVGIKKAIGQIPMGRTEFNVKGTIHDPAYQAAYDFESFLLKSDIPASQNSTTIRRLNLKNIVLTTDRINIYTHTSPSLALIAYWTNHVSVNLFAEHLFNHVGVYYYKDGSNYSGGLAIKRFWDSKINSEGLYVSDGSGLSRHNAISAFHLTEMLKYMTKSKCYTSFYSSLAIAGKSGTMKYIGRGTNAANNVRAKSGTMSRVKSYAGYATTKSGREVSFAIIVNNYNGYTSTLTKKLEQIMVEIANYNE
jgi:D-alanyl-D-alanine carboxypeptidase/D-alanyl-D-alanine-endopeptidase (penicillin-binding protein 4)